MRRSRLAIFLLLASVAPAQSINDAKLVDLTYPFNEKTIYWPNAKGFRHQKDAWTVGPSGFWYAAGEFSSAEHGGTHLDSPIHFAQGKSTVDQIPVQKLVGSVLVIDVTAACAKGRDYRVAAEDLLAWEKRHGRIAAGSIVLIRTGWGRYWPDRKQYLGSDVAGDVANLHFPGLAQSAAELLVSRKVDGVGIDTASLDHGPSKDFIAHQILNKADIYGLENIANLDKLPLAQLSSHCR